MTTETKPARALLVDDEQPILYALGVVMEADGVEVVTAGSVDQALGLLEGVDVVVTDLEMPGRSGLDLLDEVRALDPTIPVILITAHGSERIAVEALKRGAYDYISKPFDNDEVAYSVRRACETRK